MIFGFQPFHLVIIFLAALVVFGPARLPEIGRSVGKAIVEFRRGARELSEGFQGEIKAASRPAPAAGLTRADPPAPAGNFCIQCGAPNPADARFCNRCGSPLPAAESPQPEPEPEN